MRGKLILRQNEQCRIAKTGINKMEYPLVKDITGYDVWIEVTNFHYIIISCVSVIGFGKECRANQTPVKMQSVPP